MMNYVHSGNDYFVVEENLTTKLKTLPPDLYLLNITPKGQWYFSVVEKFTMPSKLYGGLEKDSHKIINTFLDRPGNTGCLLTGQKGSGKTLLAKHIALDLINKHQIPVILVNTPYTGDSFSQLIIGLNQPCMIFFDEFEKVYSDRDNSDDEISHSSDNNGSKSQKSLLTLMDGVFTSKKLFMLTCNNKWAVDSHFLDRPGRIYYLRNYDRLDPLFVEEYCKDNLLNKKNLVSIVSISKVAKSFNFDQLKCVVEELNRYDETLDTVLKYVNVGTESESERYDVEIVYGEDDKVGRKRWNCDIQTTSSYDYSRGDDYTIYEFSPLTMVKADPIKGIYHYIYNGLKATLTRCNDYGYSGTMLDITRRMEIE